MEPVNVPELVERLGSSEDPVQKMAVFRLQSAIGDPSFADTFMVEGGLGKLQGLTLHAKGNTLAYALTAYSKLLEVDKGWEGVGEDLVRRLVSLVVTNPLVNILRGAMSILAAVVSHPSAAGSAVEPDHFGFRALKPAIADYPMFLEMLVNRLTAADHALCANSLQLINALMRDAITHGADAEWPKFIKRLQDLGVIRAVYGLMQGSALQDVAQPLLEFQALTKILVRKWREVAVDFDKAEHRRALKGIHISSMSEAEAEELTPAGKTKRNSPPEWQKLGFPADGPGDEFEDVGFLGMMDLTDYVRKNEHGFQRLLLEQAAQPETRRCPVARASIAVTSILYEHFEIDKADVEDAKEYLALDSRASIDHLFKPMLLQWSKVHTAGLAAFIRLWKATGAQMPDFARIAELVRILMEAVLGGAPRTKEVHAVEEDIQGFSPQRLRQLQTELFELSYDDAWGAHLQDVRDELQREAMAFIKEQRIRCLLAGAWFSTLQATVDAGTRDTERAWGYVKLSHNRRFLHYGGFDARGERDLALEELPEKVDLSTVSSVVSNVTATTTSRTSSASTLRQSTSDPPPTAIQPRIAINSMVTPPPPPPLGDSRTSSEARSRANSAHHRKESLPRQPSHQPSHSKASSIASAVAAQGIAKSASTGAMQNGTSGRTGSNASGTTALSAPATAGPREVALLTLHPAAHSVAAEWLDGLLMLLAQPPITADTSRLLRQVSTWGLKIRLLNVRYDDEDASEAKVEVPSREGVDDDYFYDVLGA